MRSLVLMLMQPDPAAQAEGVKTFFENMDEGTWFVVPGCCGPQPVWFSRQEVMMA